jgi:hypothetical protein
VEPVPIVLRSDRRGLGAPPRHPPRGVLAIGGREDGVARVTQLPAHSDAEAAAAPDGLSRAQRAQLSRASPPAARVAAARAAAAQGGMGGSIATRVAAAAAVAAAGRGRGGLSSALSVEARRAVRRAVREDRRREAARVERRARRIEAELRFDGQGMPDGYERLFGGGAPGR